MNFTASFPTPLVTRQYPIIPSVDLIPWLPSLRDPKPLIQKDSVHIFKASTCRLWIEQPGNRYEYCIQEGPQDVQSISKAMNSLRGNVHNDKVGEPVGCCTKSNALIARAKGHDLGGIHPRDRQYSEGKEVKEQECEGYEDPLRLVKRQWSA